MPAARNFRAMLQELWMTRMQNKAQTRIQTLAKALRIFATHPSLPHTPGITAITPLTSTLTQSQRNGSTPCSHVHSSSSSSDDGHRRHSSTREKDNNHHAGHAHWDGLSQLNTSNAATGSNNSDWSHVEQLRRKVHEAMDAAARRTPPESAKSTSDAPPSLSRKSAEHVQPASATRSTTCAAFSSSSSPIAGQHHTSDACCTSKHDSSLPTEEEDCNNNNNTSPKDPSHSESNADEAASARSSASLSCGSAESLYHRVKDTVRVTRQYYNNVPFDERWDNIRRSLSVLGRLSTGNSITLYTDSSTAFTAMWDAIDAAKQEVLWQTYICKDDHVGRTTVHKMAQARQRGCARVELLYDCGGNISGRARLTEELRVCGGHVIAFRPFFRGFFHYITGGLDWRISPGLRNHRKILMVDGRVGFCGGLNIGNAYCGPELGGSGKFKDTHCAVYGPALTHLREVYDNTTQPQIWKYTWQRWRQIASRRWGKGSTTATNSSNGTNRYATIKTAARTSALQSAVKPSRTSFRSNAERGGRGEQVDHKEDAEAPDAATLGKTRWLRQRDRLRALMRWNAKPESVDSGSLATLRDVTSVAPTTADKIKTIYAARNSRTTTRSSAHDVNRDMDRHPSDATCNDESCAGRQHDSSTEGAAHEDTSVGVMRTGVMRRKVREAREGALNRVRILSHKRLYTRLLREIPLADDEPVPEAEVYSRLRSPTTQILQCHPRYSDYGIQYAFWQVTRKCHRRLWLTTPYFLPTRKLFKGLLHAAQRGVDVRILTGSQHTTDPWFMWHASNYIVERLLKGGVRVFEYKGQQVLHGKTLVVDSIWSSVGSYNWDILSNKNLEVCLCQLDTALAREMECNFLSDISLSDEIALDGHQQRSWWLRFSSWLFYNAVYVINRLTFFSYVDEDVEDSKH